MLKIAVSTGSVIGLLALSACGSTGGTTATVNNYQTQNLPGAQATAQSRPLIVLGGNKNSGSQATGIQVNAYLWRATLDTLSFMPLVSADPFGGVIITDWYQPPGDAGERYKATAYILGQDLRADGVRVTVFKQVIQNGQWTDAEVAPGTSQDIEDKVLARARQLRVQSATN